MEKVKSHDNILGKIIDLKMKESCTIIGTLYKCMPNKPCILNEITEESAVTDNFKESYTSEKDTLVLEDESGRVALLGEIPVEALATGRQLLKKSGKLFEFIFIINYVYARYCDCCIRDDGKWRWV